MWFDADLPAHRAYAEVIEEQLEAASAVIVLWSTSAIASQWVRSEANRARETGRLVQARLDDARLPMPFDQLQCADLTGKGDLDSSPGWRTVTQSLAALSHAPEPANSRPREEHETEIVTRRRGLLVGAAATAVIAGGAGWKLLRPRAQRGSIPPATAALLEQAEASLWQNTPEGQNQAIGLSRQVTTNNPELAAGWGRLAMTYALASHWRGANESALLQQRARSAAERALTIDPQDPHALAGKAWAQPFMGNWLNVIAGVQKAVASDPDDGETNFLLGMNLAMTGRSREALHHVKPFLNTGPTPGIFIWHAQMLWASGHDDDLDALLDEATKLYPTHFGVWFTRFYTQMMSGRPEAALAMGADTATWPTGIEPEEIESVVRVARAIQSRAPTQVEAVTKEWLEQARHGAGRAENAAQFMAVLGEIDDAFTVLRAYYFAEGFDPGERRFTQSQRSYTPKRDRQTAFLFNPAMAPVRRDRRFTLLTKDIGLSNYWQASGRRPDFWTH